MITLTQKNNPSEYIRDRSKRMFVRSVAPGTFVVTPKAKEKARRVVRFTVTRYGTVTVECLDKQTGDLCPANSYGRLCSHVNAAINRLHATIKRNASRKSPTIKELHGNTPNTRQTS